MGYTSAMLLVQLLEASVDFSSAKLQILKGWGGGYLHHSSHYFEAFLSRPFVLYMGKADKKLKFCSSYSIISGLYFPGHSTGIFNYL